jgi:hypothetical protein
MWYKTQRREGEFFIKDGPPRKPEGFLMFQVLEEIVPMLGT